MFSFDLSGASFEVVVLTVTVALVLGLVQGPLRSAGWMGRASRYLDLAERFAGCQGGGAERASADALRKKAAELVVWRLQSREAVGDGLMIAADKLMATLCVSLSLAADGLIRVATGSMSFGDACGLFAAGSLVAFAIDGIRALIRWLRKRRAASEPGSAARCRDDLDARVERMYRELMALPVVDDLGDRDGDGAAEQHDGDGDGERDGDQDVEGEGNDGVVL